MGTAGIWLVWPETPGCHSVRWAGDQGFPKGWEPWGRDKPPALCRVGSIAEPYSVPALWEGEGSQLCVPGSGRRLHRAGPSDSSPLSEGQSG